MAQQAAIRPCQCIVGVLAKQLNFLLNLTRERSRQREDNAKIQKSRPTIARSKNSYLLHVGESQVECYRRSVRTRGND